MPRRWWPKNIAVSEVRALEAQVEIDGASWQAADAEVVELVATPDLRIDFQVPQRFYPRINDDTTIQLSFDAYSEQTFQGRIHRKVPLSDNSAHMT